MEASRHSLKMVFRELQVKCYCNIEDKGRTEVLRTDLWMERYKLDGTDETKTVAIPFFSPGALSTSCNVTINSEEQKKKLFFF